MAEDIDSPPHEPERVVTSPTGSRRAARTAAVTTPRGRRVGTRPARAKTVETMSPTHSVSKPKAKPVRSLVILSMVVGLIATVALPAYAAAGPSAQALTIQQVASDNAQSLVVASRASTATLARDGYSATTADEIAKKKAEEAAAARAKAAAEAAAAAASAASSPSAPSASSPVSKINLNMIAPGTGAIRWPLAQINHIGDGFGARGGEHQGVDLLTDGGTPIFAAAAGVVRVSQESFGGYGVAITIDHVINGQRVSTLYGHMRYGSRQVVSGQTVDVGQVIGLVGSTGRSTANHLHFEVMINGTHVDPLAWLQANAG